MRHCASAKPLSAASAIEIVVAGTTMRTELQNPARMPSHSRPMQAEDQASAQAERSSACGSAKSEPARISSADFSEVESMIRSGIAKNSAEARRKA